MVSYSKWVNEDDREIKVTRNDIRNGVRGSEGHCALANGGLGSGLTGVKVGMDPMTGQVNAKWQEISFSGTVREFTGMITPGAQAIAVVACNDNDAKDQLLVKWPSAGKRFIIKGVRSRTRYNSAPVLPDSELTPEELASRNRKRESLIKARAVCAVKRENGELDIVKPPKMERF